MQQFDRQIKVRCNAAIVFLKDRLLAMGIALGIAMVSVMVGLSVNSFAQAASSVGTAMSKPAAVKPSASEKAVGSEADMKQKLETKLGRKIDSITKLDYAGLYEVRVDTDIVYSDVTTDHLFVGNIIDMNTRVNLTKEKVAALVEAATPKVKLADLPLASAIKIVRGNGKRQIGIFEDPNCGYCKRLEKSILDTNDVTLYVFLYPVLGPDSVEKSKAIWCAADRSKTWTNWMQQAISIPVAANANCATPLDKNLELGKKLRVDGTPTLIFNNGKRVPGAIDSDELQKMLAENG